MPPQIALARARSAPPACLLCTPKHTHQENLCDSACRAPSRVVQFWLRLKVLDHDPANVRLSLCHHCRACWPHCKRGAGEVSETCVRTDMATYADQELGFGRANQVMLGQIGT